MNNVVKRINEVMARQLAKPGLRGAINAKCIDCIYDPLAKGSWVDQVDQCTSAGCPLHNYRPQRKEPTPDHLKDPAKVALGKRLAAMNKEITE